MLKSIRGARAAMRLGMLAAVVFTAAAATVHAQDVQDLSTPDQQAAPPQQGSIALVNQVQDLQSQLQEMEGRIEQLQHQVDQMQQQNKDQYTDLDSRLGKLEGGKGAPPASAASSSIPAPSTSAPAAAGSSAAAPASATSAGTPAAPTAEEQSAYNAAFKSLRGGDYVTAARAFRGYTQKYPHSALAPNAYYWLGESYYVTQNYKVSLDTFHTLLKNYPESEKVPDALLKVGYCQAEMKQIDAARATLNTVIKQYPGTTVARLAQSRLRALKLQSAGP